MFALRLGLPGTVKVGGVYTSEPKVKFESGNRRSGTYDVYATIQQKLWEEPGAAYQGLSGFLAVTYAPADLNTIEHFVDAGLLYTGLVPGRDRDVLGLYGLYGHFSPPSPRHDHRIVRRSCGNGSGAGAHRRGDGGPARTVVGVRALRERARLGYRPRRLQRGRTRVGVSPARPRALAHIPVERGRPRRDVRRGAAPLLRARVLERARSHPERAHIRAHGHGREPRRGREGILVVRRRDADGVLAPLAVSLPARGLPVRRAVIGEPAPDARRPRIRASGNRHLCARLLGGLPRLR